jgi:tRNA(Arg) A34 adenosine deaminase TadA
MSERMTEAEFNSLLIRRVNRDGTAERLCSVAHAEITALRAALEAENEKLRAALDEAQREITQLYEDAAGESV